jgi:hypothetical protein
VSTYPLQAIRRYQMDPPVKTRVGLRRPFCSMMANMRSSSSAVAFVPPIRAYPGFFDKNETKTCCETKLPHT